MRAKLVLACILGFVRFNKRVNNSIRPFVKSYSDDLILFSFFWKALIRQPAKWTFHIEAISNGFY